MTCLEKSCGKLTTDKILVVGGAGYLGGAVTDRLKIEEKEFLVYDKLLYEDRYMKDVLFCRGDIKNLPLLMQVIDDFKPTCIIWLAAIVGDGACQVNPKETIEINQEMIKFLSDNYDGKIIFTSTCSVYGANDKELSEDSKKNPLSLYASTKLQAEEYLKYKKAVIFRLGTLFGLSDIYSRVRFDLVVNVLSMRAANGEKLTIFGGDQWRPLLHVKDAAKAIVHAATHDVPYDIYNLSSGNYRIVDIAAEIQATVPNCQIEYTEMSFEDARNYRVSTAKYQALDNQVKFDWTLAEGVKEVLELVYSGRVKDTSYGLYYNER